MTHNSDQAIIFWTKVCQKKSADHDVAKDENSNYNIIFNFLKSELPKAKNRDAFLIVFQALMSVDLKTTFLQIARTLSYDFTKNMMFSKGALEEKYKAQYLVMNVLSDFIGDGIFVEDSGVHYMIIFSLLICFVAHEREQVGVFYDFLIKILYNFYDNYTEDKNPDIAQCGRKSFRLILSLQLDSHLNRDVLLDIMRNTCELCLLLGKTKLLHLIKK